MAASLWVDRLNNLLALQRMGANQIRHFIKEQRPARSLAELKVCRCSLVNTIPQCHDDKFEPDTLFNSGVVHLKTQRTSLSAIINKRIRDGVNEKIPKRNRKLQQKSVLYRRLRSNCTKLDKSNVKPGITIRSDNIKDFTDENYAALKLKRPQRELCCVPETKDINYFSTSEFFVRTAVKSFPNSFSAGLDGISPEIWKDLTTKSNGQSGRSIFSEP